MREFPLLKYNTSRGKLVILLSLFIFAVFFGFLLELITVEKLYLLTKFHHRYFISKPKPFRPKDFLITSKLNSASGSDLAQPNLGGINNWEKTSLLNISIFKWLRNNETLCKPETDRDGEELYTLPVLVHSARSHFIDRLSIRKSWGSLLRYENWSIRLVFLMGEAYPSTNETQLMKEETLLDKEQSLFGDIVTGNFIDSYRNLTYKHMMGYKWILNFCLDAKFIFKMDDDIFIDIRHFLDWRTEELTSSANGTAPVPAPDMYCITFRRTKPQRCKKCKWYSSSSEWPKNNYPAYCSGWWYATTVDIVRKLYSVIDKVPFFWVDDVFATGVLMEEAKRINEGFKPKVRHIGAEVGPNNFKKFRPMCEQHDMTMNRTFRSVVPVPRGGKFDRDMMCLWNKTMYDRNLK